MSGAPTVASGAAVATHVSDGEAYTFPEVPPEPVAVAPAAFASFNIEYIDGCAAGQTTSIASSLSILLPGEIHPLRLEIGLAPCGGDLIVSPLVAGTSGVQFS
ncbi:MAG: hypothetical protein ACRDX8_01335 [Acidimicrobiales bacterium]